jgi:ParB family transcriptional regulator, chromosome partitioning protein
VSKRIGLPVTLKMRHDAHYVETLTSFSGASIGRMIPIDKIRPNPDQPRKNIGDIRELSDSIREKGVLEPLLVRYIPREDSYYIISGERRYHASKAAGLHELPCIEKIADDAETLELALIENLQRKDLTPFEEADGLQRLAEHFDYTHDDIAKKIGRARSSVTETLSLRLIPDSVRKVCLDKGIISKSLLLQVARQPNEKKMREMTQRITMGGMTRDEARRARKEETESAPRPQPFVFNFQPEDGSFRLRLEFRKSHVSQEELAAVLRAVLRQIESGSAANAAGAGAGPGSKSNPFSSSAA